jgi:hypothetical protein
LEEVFVFFFLGSEAMLDEERGCSPLLMVNQLRVGGIQDKPIVTGKVSH